MKKPDLFSPQAPWYIPTSAPKAYGGESIDLAGVHVSFQRTCRVPQGKQNSLPAGLGRFPIYKVRDYRSGCPGEWRDDGAFMPMYPQEAMWMSLSAGEPRALVVGAGNINAITGKPFAPPGRRSELDIKLEKEQNYLVAPPQPWLDGWKAEDGKVYQFVAAELGSGETVEGQITGQETVGGIQLVAYEPAMPLPAASRPFEHVVEGGWGYGGFNGTFGGPKYELLCFASSAVGTRSAQRAVTGMGLGRGGEIIQKVYPDPYGVDVWKQQPCAVEAVYLVSSEDFRQITGRDAPPTPVTYEAYKQYGLPWFELWDKHLADAPGSGVFGKLKPVTSGKKPASGAIAPPGSLLDKLT